MKQKLVVSRDTRTLSCIMGSEERGIFIRLKSGKGDFAMKKASLNDRLEKEQEKLRKLGEEALKNGIPLTQDEAFMAQNRKVDELVVKVIKEKERHRKKQRER